MRREADPDEPIDRAQLRSAVRYAAEDMREWVLGAFALVSLHLIQFVLLQAPWTERRRSGDGVDSGFELVGSDVPGGSWVVLSIMLLIVSVAASFVGLLRRSRPPLVLVAVLSVIRIVTVVGASRAAADGFDSRFSRYGIALTVWTLVATLIVSVIVAVLYEEHD